MGRHVAANNATCADDGSLADGHAFENDAVEADPGVIANGYGPVGFHARFGGAGFGRPVGVKVRIHNNAVGGQQNLAANADDSGAGGYGRAAELRAGADVNARAGAKGAQAHGACQSRGRGPPPGGDEACPWADGNMAARPAHEAHGPVRADALSHGYAHKGCLAAQAQGSPEAPPARHGLEAEVADDIGRGKAPLQSFAQHVHAWFLCGILSCGLACESG